MKLWLIRIRITSAFKWAQNELPRAKVKADHRKKEKERFNTKITTIRHRGLKYMSLTFIWHTSSKNFTEICRDWAPNCIWLTHKMIHLPYFILKIMSNIIERLLFAFVQQSLPFLCTMTLRSGRAVSKARPRLSSLLIGKRSPSPGSVYEMRKGTSAKWCSRSMSPLNSSYLPASCLDTENRRNSASNWNKQ